ncbi:MAG TPA: lasso peptide biosynthesis B2 protein, partial [Candidatus Xenobia bacterium]
GVARLAILVFPFAWVASHLGRSGPRAPQEVSASQAAMADRIGWAVRAASRVSPWKSNCLPQAMTARWLLRRRGIPCTLYLGVRRGLLASMKAHAWLKCGSVCLTGGDERAGFAVVAVFS